ncbi:MAG: Ni/Fe hydrogenase subunit alpha [Patescibacteria group bacterium]|nr:Ni/Fe hydrogenase subunit alpha [Patescibacteria group bacterium]
MKESVLNHYICKIEGHGELKLNYKTGRARLEIDEGERLFEKLVTGRDYLDAPFITARICGVCPTAHALASIKAIEHAFKVELTPNIIALRKALLAGQIIQSHSLHLFFLALPDYLDVVNAVELHQERPEIFALATTVKKIGDQLVETIGGRAVHPTAPTIGGFLSVPDKNILKKLRDDLESHLPQTLEAAELFANFKYPSLRRETEYLATENSEHLSYYDCEKIISNRGLETPVENYAYAFKEEVRNDSPAKYGKRDGHGFMVGALARLSLDSEHLHPKAAYAYRQIWQKKIPSYNSYHNNIAQAIEIIHLAEEAIIQIDNVLNDRNQVFKVPYRVIEGEGAGAVEAPRGTLYHGVKISEEGKIELYDIVTPTDQNLLNLEEDATELMSKHKDLSSEKLYREIEMLIRAYDPCITCAVH